jgi:release factor glutamine methyltransferase
VVSRCRDWLRRRAIGEPAHHLTGRCRFWGREFEVTPAVLVPRPETELVVEVALQLPVAGSARVLDVGTGSGCIAITLAAERSGWDVLGVDRSHAALEVARNNATRLGVDLQLVCGDLGSAVGIGLDLVTANLPYIPTDRLADLPLEVHHDPVVALDGGVAGLELITRLIADLPRLLRPCGGAVLELGERQVDTVVDIANTAGLAAARRVRDLEGVDRVIVLERR